MSGVILNDVDLHDAIVQRIDIDILAGVITVDVSFYEALESKQRKLGVIKFQGVRNSSLVLDFISLLDNSRSGNVNSWDPAALGGNSNIRMLDGYISIGSTKVELTER
ncbi:hypothetical protein [Stenotrophomonas sp. ESTM1D_MKCIP4_1]|uniref:hypothetical protein n=1 Tax=Stenotrophomonas sp. ESTM1D_MKCIP4_1 TaxID=2072414 RepID=UPI00131F1AFF|nr:hypothetical protein [Stenotrophomonas sp. ESTM1D_MKCIP4_1]